jgi:hypothetical protein
MNSKFNTVLDFDVIDGIGSSLGNANTNDLFLYLVKDDLQTIREEFRKTEFADFVNGETGLSLLEKISIRLQRVLPKTGMTVNYSDIKSTPIQKNDKKLIFPAGNPIEIDVTDPEGKKPIMNKIMVNKKTPPVGNKLNYYKP